MFREGGDETQTMSEFNGLLVHRTVECRRFLFRVTLRL